MEPSREFWYNLKTKEVESGPQSLSMDRVGPFSSFEEATRGPQIIADRARRIREEADREESWD